MINSVLCKKKKKKKKKKRGAVTFITITIGMSSDIELCFK
jgi:hypothetical protein